MIVTTSKLHNVKCVRVSSDAIISALSKISKNRDIVIEALSSDLRFIDNPKFHNTISVLEILNAKIEDDFELMAEKWNMVFNDALVVREDKVGTPTTTISHETMAALFLRMNYAKSQLKKIQDKVVDEQKLKSVDVQRVVHWWPIIQHDKNALIVSNIGLVMAMGKRMGMFRHSNDVPEAITEGTIALLHSVDKFNIDRGFKFSTYACRSIIKGFSRYRVNRAKKASHFKTTDFSIQPEAKVGSFDFAVNIELDDLRRALDDNTADLNEDEQLVIRLRFFAEDTLESIGSMIGVTKERVRQIQNKALRKLRLALEGEAVV